MKKLHIPILAALGCIVIALLFLFAGKKTYKPGSRSISPFSIEVIYDESHDNSWSIRDTGFYGYSGFAMTLMDHGLMVSRNTLPLGALIATMRPVDMPNKALILNVAKYRRYTPDEIIEVERFVRAGGALLVIGEHENMYGSSDFQNDMLRPFGMELGNDFVGDVIPHERLENATTAILNQKAFSDELGCPEVRHLLSAPVKACAGAAGLKVLLCGYRDGRAVPIAAGLPFGRGRSAVLGDSELFWNADGSTGIGIGENRLFLVRMFEWLLGGKLPEAQADTRPKNAPGKSGTGIKIFIDISSHGRGTDDSMDGMGPFAEYLKSRGFTVCTGRSCARYDVRMVAEPLSVVSYSPEARERMILIAGSRQVLSPGSEWGSLLLKMGAQNPASIYAQVEEAMRFRVQPCFLTDGGLAKNYLEIEFVYKNARRPLHRAGSIDIRRSGLKEWLLPGDAVWGEMRHPGVENMNQGVPVFDAADIRRPMLAAYDPRILIITSGDFITPGRGDDRFFTQVCEDIVTWIRTGDIK